MITTYFSFKILYYVVAVILSYLLLFYLVLPLNMNGRQIRWHILITCFWAFGVLSGSLYLPIHMKLLFALVWELGYVVATLYMFALGDTCKNFVVLWGLWQIINIVVQSAVALLEPDFYYIYSDVEMKNARFHDFILVYIITIITACLLRPIGIRVLKFTEQYKVIYHYCIVFLIVAGMWEYEKRIVAQIYPFGQMDFRILLVLVMFFISMPVILRMKGKMLEQEKHAMQRELSLLEHKYEKLVSDNQDMKTFRHEISRHMQALKDAAPFVTSEQMHNYIEELENRNSGFFDLSLCGNLYIDTMLEQYYDRLKEENVLLETVLEPIELDSEQTVEIMNILEDMFEYAMTSVKHKQWCRLSIRSRGKMRLCQLEIGYHNPREYYRQRILNYIGSELYIRQRFSSTNQIIKKYNGMEMHWLEEESLVFAAITPIGEN